MAPWLPALLAALLLAPAASALLPPTTHPPGAAPLALPPAGPEAPVVTAPAAVVTAFQDEQWAFTEGSRTHLVTVPAAPGGAWDRIILSYRSYPSDSDDQDPWDRLCSAAIAGVEVLRCTTPRTDFTLRKDITEFASLLPPGAEVPVTSTTGSWVGDGLWVTIKLEFYDDEPTAPLAPAPAGSVLPAWYHRTLCARGTPLTATVDFPVQAPASADVEITLSGHSATGEFWFLSATWPVFHLLVDGQEVAQVWAMPYTYAFIGFEYADYTWHPLMWWTAQRALDEAGVHLGVGEIPPYRVSLPSEVLPLLTGSKVVTLRGENGGCYWPSSVAFLLGQA